MVEGCTVTERSEDCRTDQAEDEGLGTLYFPYSSLADPFPTEVNTRPGATTPEIEVKFSGIFIAC